MRQSIAAYALSENIVRQIDAPGFGTIRGRRDWRCMVASHALSEGCELVEVGSVSPLSETEACDAIRGGRVVEVVS